MPVSVSGVMFIRASRRQLRRFALPLKATAVTLGGAPIGGVRAGKPIGRTYCRCLPRVSLTVKRHVIGVANTRRTAAHLRKSGPDTAPGSST